MFSIISIEVSFDRYALQLLLEVLLENGDKSKCFGTPKNTSWMIVK